MLTDQDKSFIEKQVLNAIEFMGYHAVYITVKDYLHPTTGTHEVHWDATISFKDGSKRELQDGMSYPPDKEIPMEQLIVDANRSVVFRLTLLTSIFAPVFREALRAMVFSKNLLDGLILQRVVDLAGKEYVTSKNIPSAHRILSNILNSLKQQLLPEAERMIKSAVEAEVKHDEEK
jgi:hypothetical protein